MDKKKMLVLQTVAVMLIIVAFMVLVYEYPQYHAKQQVGEEQPQQTVVQMQSMSQITSWRTEQSCGRQPIKNNFVFIKVRRAGSTTLQCVLMRYAYNHNLHVVLPKNGLELKLTRASTFDDLPWVNGAYNVIAHGMTYQWKVHDVMPNDTTYFSILRDPRNHFLSMFNFYNVGQVLGITGKSQASKLLKDPTAITNKKGMSETEFRTSVSMSAQARDLGFAPGTDLDKTQSSLDNFRNITRDFGMILILEHLPESLVLLRRVMCWKLQDILHLDMEVSKYGYKNAAMGDRQVANLKDMNKIDFQLYDFFNQSLWKTIKGLGQDFLDEVKFFREINLEVAKYCRQIEISEDTISKLQIPKGKWTGKKGFYVHQKLCEELKLEFEDWDAKFVMRRNAEVRKKEALEGIKPETVGDNKAMTEEGEEKTPSSVAQDALKEMNVPDLPLPPGQGSS